MIDLKYIVLLSLIVAIVFLYIANFCFGKKGIFKKGDLANIVLKCPGFKEGERLPKDYTCEGKNISPNLVWENVPEGTKSFVIICDDPDAPGKTWVHWVIFNIPATAKQISEGVASLPTLPDGSIQGKNDFGKIGYGGACPPKGGGDHRYFFKIYALDITLALNSGVRKEDVKNRMKEHVLGQGILMGVYSRD